jgi:predicted RNA polymerase sigma factor
VEDDLCIKRKKIIKAALAFGLPLAEAEDAASFATIKALQDTGKKQSPYFVVIDYLRSQGYQGKNSYFRKNLEIGDSKNEKTVALEAVDQSKLLQTVANLFAGLDVECRSVLILHLVWGLKRSEIAFVFGVELKNVDAIIRRAKRRLLKEASLNNVTSD